MGITSPPVHRLLVESGPPPLQLSNGNFLFLHNSATVSSRPSAGSFGSYNVGWVIISSDGLTILQRSQVSARSLHGVAPAWPSHIQCITSPALVFVGGEDYLSNTIYNLFISPT